jgi:hypothetical protein
LPSIFKADGVSALLHCSEDYKARLVMVAQLMQQSTNDLNFKGSKSAATCKGWERLQSRIKFDGASGLVHS